MKEGIHPEYRPVAFLDINTGKEFLNFSTKKGNDTKEINGVEHQVIALEITSDTHPFWTGKMHRIDSAGRIDRFNKRFDKVVGGARKTRKANTTED